MGVNDDDDDDDNDSNDVKNKDEQNQEEEEEQSSSSNTKRSLSKNEEEEEEVNNNDNYCNCCNSSGVSSKKYRKIMDSNDDHVDDEDHQDDDDDDDDERFIFNILKNLDRSFLGLTPPRCPNDSNCGCGFLLLHLRTSILQEAIETEVAVMMSNTMKNDSIEKDDSDDDDSVHDITPEHIVGNIVRSSCQKNVQLDRAVGAVLGQIMSDALGAPLEFIPCRDDLPNPKTGEYDDDETSSSCIRRPCLTFSNNKNDNGIMITTPLYKHAYNKFHLKPGQWTDDGSMALCLADSLLVHHGEYHGGDCRSRYYNWWFHGYNNAFRFDNNRQRRNGGRSVGLGGNISKSLHGLMQHTNTAKTADDIPKTFDDSGNGNEDAGNGSIMRLSPVPVCFHRNIRLAEVVSEQQSKGTHPGNDAASCCKFITYFVIRAIQIAPSVGFSMMTKIDDVRTYIEETINAFLTTHDMNENDGLRRLYRILTCNPPRPQEQLWNWKQDRLPMLASIRSRGHSYSAWPTTSQQHQPSYSVDVEYFGSYCMDGLCMALWSLWNSTCYDDAVLRAVNLLGDADTVGAICGQMAGAMYGFMSMNNAVVVNEESSSSSSSSSSTTTHNHHHRIPGQLSSAMLEAHSMWDPWHETALRAILLYYVRRTIDSDTKETCRILKI